MHLNQRLFTVAAAALVCGVFLAGRPASAQTQIQAGQIIISELRLRGPAGATDEFVEVYNNTDQDIVVQATDTSPGWGVFVSNGQFAGQLFTIPNGTTIPARGHFLGANSEGYSLSEYPSGNPNIISNATNALKLSAFALTTPNATWEIDVPDGTGVALFSTTSGTNLNAATRLDAFGYTGSPALYREGAGFPTVITTGSEHTHYRDLRSTRPQDTNNNAADFVLVGTVVGDQITRLGAPGPENLSSPIVNNTDINGALLDPAVGSSSPPNRERRPNVEPNADLGTLLIRRTITNFTGQPVSRLRFRVIATTTLGSPASECGNALCADVRALTSQDGEAAVGGEVVTVRGLRLEEPPTQPAGGGYNASLSADFITLETPLLPGQSINVVFKLGVMREGPFRFIVNIEALNIAGEVIIESPVASGLGAKGATNIKNRRLIVQEGQTTLSTSAAPSAAPASPAAQPSAAAPRNAYVPWFIDTRPAASKPTRAAEDEADDEDKAKESKESPSSMQPAPQTPEASAPDSEAAAAGDPAPRSSSATIRGDSSNKLPAAAKTPRRRGQ